MLVAVIPVLQLFQSLFMANFGHVSWLDHHFCGLSHHVSPVFMAADQSPGLPRHFARLIEVKVQHLLRSATETTLELWCLSPLQEKKLFFHGIIVSITLRFSMFSFELFSYLHLPMYRIDFERSFCAGLSRYCSFQFNFTRPVPSCLPSFQI